MFLSALSLSVALMQTPVPKTQVMVLGTFHFDSPGLDVINMSVDNIEGERRQKEIIAIVDALAQWKPTKICLEAPPESVVPQRYLSYLEGGYQLSKSESDQIGFRLAQKLGHKAVYAVDYKSDMDFNGVMKYAAENGQIEGINALIGEAQAELGKTFAPEAAEKLTLAQILATMNEPKADQFSHSMYLELAKVGGGKDYPGADMVGGWITRNLKIAVNVARVTKPGDRVLVIFGAGHAKLLRDNFREMRGMEEVSPLGALRAVGS